MAYTTQKIWWVDLVGGSDAGRTGITGSTLANNGSGLTRVTKTAHGLITDQVILGSSWSAYYNAYWKVTVIDADHFDLQESSYAASSGGTWTPQGGERTDPLLTPPSAAKQSNDPNPVVRLAKSPSAVSTSVNATFTKGSRNIVLASALSKSIDDMTALWTGGTNVTVTANTSFFKQGTQCNQTALSASFTTGIIAYKDLGSTIDLSSYQQVSLWVRVTAGTVPTAGQLQLKMYSDSSRTALVETLNLPTIASSGSGAWQAVTINKGSALSSTVRAIEIVATATMASRTFLWNSMFAAQASGSAGELHLRSLIGTNDGLWMNIRNISSDGLTLELDEAISISSGNGRGYPKTTTTTTLYTRLCQSLASPSSATTTAVITFNKGGSSDSQRATISGGWDLSSGTQTDYTWFDGQNGNGLFSFPSYSNISRLCFSRTYYCFGNATATNYTFSYCHSSNVSSAFLNISQLELKFVIDNCICFGGQYFQSLTLISGGSITNCYASNQTASCIYMTRCVDVIFDGNTFVNAGGSAANIQTSRNIVFYTCTLSDSAIGVNIQDHGVAVFFDCTLTGNTTHCVCYYVGKAFFIRCTVSGYSILHTFQQASQGCLVQYHDFNQVAGDHRIYNGMGSVLRNTSTVHGSAAQSYNILPTSANANEMSPIEFPIARLVCRANVARTITAWVYRSNTGLSIEIMVKKNWITGVAKTEAYAAGSAGSWEQLSLTFTPTVDGVIDVFCQAYGGTTYSAFIGDLSLPANVATKALDFDFGGNPFSSNAGETSGGTTQTIGHACFGG